MMMRKFLLAVVALMLACSLVIGAGSPEVKAQGKKNTKLIKIWVNKDNGKIVEVRLGKDTPPDQDANVVPGKPNYQYRGTILFYQQNSNCTVIRAGVNAWQVCYPSLETPKGIKIR